MTKSPSPMFENVLAQLRANPKATYAEVRDKAARKGFTVAPIVYGRAQVCVGIVKAKPRSDRRGAQVASVRIPKGGMVTSWTASSDPKLSEIGYTVGTIRGRLAPLRGPGRPRKQMSAVTAGEQLGDVVRALVAERDAAVRVLSQIAELVHGLAPMRRVAQ